MHYAIERLLTAPSSDGRERVTLIRHPDQRVSAPPADESGGKYVAVLISIEGNRPVRLWRMVTFRLQIALSRARLRGLGAADIRALAAVPTIDNPTFLYELGTPAGRYADDNLRLGGTRTTIRSIMRAMMGCDPATGSVLVVGRFR